MYSETRLEDMIAWNNAECKVNDVTIVDKIRFFKGKFQGSLQEHLLSIQYFLLYVGYKKCMYKLRYLY